MIYNPVYRAIQLAIKKFHKNNIEKVKASLKINSYSKKCIEKYINIRLNKIKPCNNEIVHNSGIRSKKVVVLPYVSGVYERVLSNLKKMKYRYCFQNK